MSKLENLASSIKALSDATERLMDPSSGLNSILDKAQLALADVPEAADAYASLERARKTWQRSQADTQAAAKVARAYAHRLA